MTMQDLYNYIKNEYGVRGAWISDIAKALKISKNEANLLTYAMGYRRGKEMQHVSFQQFAAEPGVKLIQLKI
jgi:hypothetical protein